jgi:DNA invertase Pin-like site-specific DNA recombinase
VIVERADRLARDLMVSEVILDQLTRAGAKVLTADGADLTSAEGERGRGANTARWSLASK